MDTIEGGKWLPEPGSRVDAGHRRDRAHSRARKRARLLLRSQSRRHDPPEGLRGPDVRPHRAQGRPHRHRDHESPRRAGLGARHRAARGAPRARVHRGRATAHLPASLLIDMRTGEHVFMQAKAVLLATGGGPTMYRFHTPSGDKSCDGLAMALRFGLPLRDMEMVQFHPTGLLAGRDTRMTGTVLEEGLRGAGGLPAGRRRRAVHGALRRARRSARRATSSRARSIAEMRAGRTTPNGGVWICRWRTSVPDNVRRQFKGMVERCADCGFDLAGGRVEVVPTAHYMMGGVEFAPDCTTGCAGLFVAGEDSGGVHGANRLGGNGVANSTVFGGIAGDTMARWVAREGAWRDARCRGDRRRGRAGRGGVRGRAAAVACAGRDPRASLRRHVGRRGHRAQRAGLARAAAALDRSRR